MQTTKKPGMYNFGARGWSVVGFQVVWLFFMTGMTVDGLNIIVPGIAAYRGWNPDTVLSLSTPASIIALVLCILWGGFITKFGTKRTMIVTMVAAGLATIFYGNAPTIPLYAIALVLMITLICAFSLNVGMAICTNWFPTKKGVIMGLATIGMNLASALINQILNPLSMHFGIAMAISIMGCAILFVALLTAIFVKEKPEDAGCYPDNDPAVAELIHQEEERTKNETPIGYKEALKNKYVWIFGIAYGFFGMATVGIMSQLVGFFMATKGWELQTAINTVTIAAIIGIFGSVMWGTIDQKIGTKKTSTIFGIWYCIGILLLLAPNTFVMWIGIVMLGAGIGGNGNFPPSMTALVFGRKDFPTTYACLNTIVGIVRSCSFVILAILRGITSGYTVPYVFFAAVALIGGLMFIGVRVHVAVGNKEQN